MVKLPTQTVDYDTHTRTMICQGDMVTICEYQCKRDEQWVTVDSETVDMASLMNACDELERCVSEFKKLKRQIKHRNRLEKNEQLQHLKTRFTELEHEITDKTGDMKQRVLDAVLSLRKRNKPDGSHV